MWRRHSARALGATLGVVAVCAASPATAQDAVHSRGTRVAATARTGAPSDPFNPRVGRVTNGFFYRNATLIRVNPLGLFNDLRVGLRRRVFDAPALPLVLRNTYFAAGMSLALSPAFVRPGLFVEFSPVAVVVLQASAERVQWFGTFNYLQTFPSANANFSDAEISRRGDASARAVGSWMFSFGGTLQARVGSLAIRTNTRAVWQEVAANGVTDPVFYDIFHDAMVPNGGWMIANDTDVIAQATDLGLNVGLRFSLLAPLCGSSCFPDSGGVAAQGAGAANSPITRLGPLVSYTFREARHGWFNAPTVFLLAQWWLTHRYRTGDGPESISQGLPMIVLGFAFRGDS